MFGISALVVISYSNFANLVDKKKLFLLLGLELKIFQAIPLSSKSLESYLSHTCDNLCWHCGRRFILNKNRTIFPTITLELYDEFAVMFDNIETCAQ